MFAEERHSEILNILNNEGKIVVKDLSNRFSVTEDCIRKDLKILESKTLLRRTYGGAIPYREAAHKESINHRKKLNLDLKSVIAKKAFDIIKDGETIFLDISTTNILLAKMLCKTKKKLTVITNMLDVMSALNSEENNITVISPGGVLNKNFNGFTGSTTIEALSNYKFSRSFIGSCGVNLNDKSVTTFDADDGNTKKAIIRNSQKVYLVMESSKFYFDGTYKFAVLNDIDTIITDSMPNKDVLKILSKVKTDIL